MSKITLRDIVDSDIDCINLGSNVSQNLSQGDILLLYGDLGSGKTTFVKGILRGLDYKDDVTSPTFTLVNEYNAKYKVIHIDFYREKNVDRWINLGIDEYFDGLNIVIIEWPNLIPSLLPDNSIKIFFEHISEYKRKIFTK
tara:strand:+ start:52 stop:474 length:423 start_codon:yes stop_codon:yes gene_type:complete